MLPRCLLFKYYDFFWNCVCKLCIQFIVIQVFLLSVSRSQFSKNSIDKTAVQLCKLDERWKEITIFDGRLAHLFVEIITRKKFFSLIGLKIDFRFGASGTFYDSSWWLLKKLSLNSELAWRKIEYSSPNIDCRGDHQTNKLELEMTQVNLCTKMSFCFVLFCFST